MKKTNNVDIKKNNRNIVYKYVLRHEHTSRPEITAAVGLSSPTVIALVNELAADGFLVETGEMESTGGRRAKTLSAATDLFYSVGINIGSHYISFVLTNLSENLLSHERFLKEFENSAKYFQEVNEMVRDFLRVCDVEEQKILGIGISFSGIVNYKARTIELVGETGRTVLQFDLIREYFSFPCYFINDAKAAAFTEAVPIGTKGNFFYFSLSNKVGGAIVNNREGMWTNHEFGDDVILPRCLEYGYNWRSGEIGHTVIHPNGRRCVCGKRGCMNAYCSAKVLAQHKSSLKEFILAMEAGNQEFEAIWDRYLDDLAISINNIRMLMDCHIVLGGYVGGFMKPYKDRLYAKINALNSLEEKADYLNICQYPVAAAAFGAALIVVDNYVNCV